MKQAAVFLDRDGTIIEDMHYLSDPTGVRLLPGAVQGLRMMQEKGYLLFIVSNQSGVGQGIISSKQFWAVHQRCCEILKKENVDIAEFSYCLHAPEEDCRCRKPAVGLVPSTYNGIAIDWSRSVTVGDKLCDLRLAEAIGSAAYLVLTGKGELTQVALENTGEAGRYRAYASLAEVARELPDGSV